MANGIYKCTLHGRYLGQSIVNTLWYRSVLEGTFAGDLLIDAASALGKSVISHVWQAFWRTVMPTNFYLDGVSVMGYNDMYELLYNNTITVAPDAAIAAGTQAATEDQLPLANCANIAFNLKNKLITLPWFKPPRKGLVAISPIQQGWAGNDGTLNDYGMGVIQHIANDMASPLPWDYIDIDMPFTGWQATFGLPGAFLPIRAKTWQWDTPQVLGGITYMKHIECVDVESAVARKALGYRRSRRVEV